MKYVKMLGLLAVAAAALMAFAGTASATTLTSPTGTEFTGTIEAEASSSTLHNTSLGVSVSCSVSKVKGKVETSGAGVTAGGKISNLTFESCGEDTVKVLANGSLEVHSIAGTENGTLTSSGASVTITDASTGVSCTYTTSGTDLGTVKGGSPATLAIDSVTISRTGDSIFCGSKGEWTGSYTVTSPSSLYVD